MRGLHIHPRADLIALFQSISLCFISTFLLCVLSLVHSLTSPSKLKAVAFLGSTRCMREPCEGRNPRRGSSAYTRASSAHPWMLLHCFSVVMCSGKGFLAATRNICSTRSTYRWRERERERGKRGVDNEKKLEFLGFAHEDNLSKREKEVLFDDDSTTAKKIALVSRNKIRLKCFVRFSPV